MTGPTIPVVHAALTADLRETIDSWTPQDAEERLARTTWRCLATRPELLVRSGEPAHFTASALPTRADGARVLLVLHRRLGLWVQPGGHFEPGDHSVAAAASRELAEETGLAGEMDPVPLLLSRHPAPCGVGDWHLDVQMLAVIPEGRPVVNDESLDAAWFDLVALPPGAAPGLQRLAAAAVTRLETDIDRP